MTVCFMFGMLVPILISGGNFTVDPELMVIVLPLMGLLLTIGVAELGKLNASKRMRFIASHFGFKMSMVNHKVKHPLTGQPTTLIGIRFSDIEGEVELLVDNSFAELMASDLLERLAIHNITDFGTDAKKLSSITPLQDIINKHYKPKE